MDPLIVLGEVRTCLLPDSAALSPDSATELLSVVPGRGVVSRTRPVPLTVAAPIPVGVDCKLATASGSPTRGIGTVATTAVAVDGRVLQSSARATVTRSATTRRQRWGHYLDQVGLVEVVTKVPADRITREDLAVGYLANPNPMDTLDLGSISERLLSRIRLDARLNQRSPFRAATTRLRWTATVDPIATPHVTLHLVDDTTRSVRVTVADAPALDSVQRLCEDIAVHDWLLTTVGAAIEEADRFPAGSPAAADTFAPVLAHLGHLWMPGAHAPARVRGLWEQLHIDPGFTRQWTARVGQLRDRMTVATLDALRHTHITTSHW